MTAMGLSSPCHMRPERTVSKGASCTLSLTSVDGLASEQLLLLKTLAHHDRSHHGVLLSATKVCASGRLPSCRGMRGKEAVKKCPELQLVQVPVTHGKAELGPYRAAGKQVCGATCFGSSHAVE